MKKITYFIISLLGFFIISSGCRKIINVGEPATIITREKVYADSASIVAVLGNTYALFEKTVDNTYTQYAGLYADELNYTSTSSFIIEYLQSAVSPSNTANPTTWQNLYFAIYECNDLIEGLTTSTAVKPATRDQYIGEAKFLRAYAYFILVNTYGAVPLSLQTDVGQTSLAPRSDINVVYQQIIQDLSAGQAALPEVYSGAGRVRANKWAATALLARVFLYQKRYAEAEQAASLVINSGLYTPLQAPATVFLAGSKESILQFYTQNGFITIASSIVPSSTTGIPQYVLPAALISAFEAGDLRRAAWVGTATVTSGGTATTYYYPYKYHNRAANTSAPEYLMGLRVAEQYLIRAEARVQQNNIPGAVADINVIRQRAGLGGLSTSISAATCMDAILHERQTELFMEWGHRFMDLKRTGRIDAVLGSYKSTWKPTAALLPIPQTELNADPKLVQNPGY